MKTYVLKLYEADIPSKWHNIDEDQLTLLSHQEFNLENNTPNHITKLMAQLARFINCRRSSK